MQSIIHLIRERPWLGAALMLAFALGLMLLWRVTPLSEFLDSEWLIGQFRSVFESKWAPVTVTAAYLLANALVFPNMALNLALIVALGPWLGVPVALAETVFAGVVVFGIGRRWGADRFSSLKIDSLDKALDLIRDSGLPGMILLRMIPIAPYPIVNLWLGVCAVKTSVFVLGTAIGVFPSLIAMGVIGLSLRELWESPTWTNIAILISVVGGYLLLGWMIKQKLSHHMKKDT